MMSLFKTFLELLLWNSFQYSIFGPETAWLRAPCEQKHYQVGEPDCRAKVQVFFYSELCVTASIFPHTKLGWLAVWNEFKVNSNLFMEESDEYCLYSWVWNASSISTVYATHFPFWYLLPFKAKRAVYKCNLHSFLTSHNFMLICCSKIQFCDGKNSSYQHHDFLTGAVNSLKS